MRALSPPRGAAPWSPVSSSTTLVPSDVLSVDIPTPKSPPGQYCYYTKKKNEVEQMHQEQQIRLVMLILYNWFSQPPKSANKRASFLASPEALYVNSVLTNLPLTYEASSTTSYSTSEKAYWWALAERVYAELGESPPDLVASPPRVVARAILVAIHGMKAPDFVFHTWRSRSGRIDSRWLLAGVGAVASGRSFEVVVSGGGPVGLTVAILLAHCSLTSSSRARMPNVKIKVYEQRLVHDDGKLRWRDERDPHQNRRRRQVITLQDYVVALLDEGFKAGVPLNWSELVWPSEKTDVGIDMRRGAERVYVNSRQAPIRDVEDRLLAEIRDSPVLSRHIELIPERVTDESFAAMRDRIDLFVGADGASSKAFTVNYQEQGQHVFEREVLEAHQTDRALGIPINCVPTASQAEIVFLTLCQTIYLLNSTSNGLGFLNIRLPQDLYDSLRDIPAEQRTFQFLIHSSNPLHTHVVALIDAGFRLFGLDVTKVLDERIDIFRLSLASAPRVVTWVPKDVHKGRDGGQFPMVLVGDAAMQHNFWPGRGANSGLMAAWSLCANVLRAFETPNFRGLVDAHLSQFEGFMRSLKVREHDGRGRFIQMIDIERIYASAFPAKPISMPTLHTARDSLWNRACAWRDRLGSRPEFILMHPVPVSDAGLMACIDRLCGAAFRAVTQNSPMAIMDSAILTLLEGSQQWPTSDMNPLGYELSPRGFVQPSLESMATPTPPGSVGGGGGGSGGGGVSISMVRSLSPTSLPDARPILRGRARSSSAAPPMLPNMAVDTHPAWLANALLGVKPNIKAWGDTSKAAEKEYRKAVKEGYGSNFEKLYSQRWEWEEGWGIV